MGDLRKDKNLHHYQRMRKYQRAKGLVSKKSMTWTQITFLVVISHAQRVMSNSNVKCSVGPICFGGQTHAGRC